MKRVVNSLFQKINREVVLIFDRDKSNSVPFSLNGFVVNERKVDIVFNANVVFCVVAAVNFFVNANKLEFSFTVYNRKEKFVVFDLV